MRTDYMTTRRIVGDLVVDLLETEMKVPFVVIGWTLQQQHYRPHQVYRFRAVTDEPYEWTFLMTESMSSPKVIVDLNGKKTETIVTGVDHFKKIVQGVNEKVYGATTVENAHTAMLLIQTVFAASSLKAFHFNQGIRSIEDGNALEIDMIRIYDASVIKIGMERKKEVTELGNEFVQPFFYVTLTTDVESESGQTVRLPPKEVHDLKDAATALQTAVSMRLDWLKVPDMPRRERTDPSLDSRRYSPGDLSVSVFTADQLMQKLHEGCEGFKDYFVFVEEGKYYKTRHMVQPYIFVTIKPDLGAQKIKVAFETGLGSDASEKKEELWSHTGEVAKKAMILLNALVRQYMDTPLIAKNCLESLLVYRKEDLRYEAMKKKAGFDVKIHGESDTINIRYKETYDHPAFLYTCTSVGDRTTEIKCYHPSRIALSIDFTIRHVKKDAAARKPGKKGH